MAIDSSTHGFNNMSAVTSKDRRVPTPRGRIFIRCWQPTTWRAAGASPVILLHDSLGCVELWRDFRRELCLALGREVIAYGRIGFGQTDPRHGQVPKTFVENEAGESFAHGREAEQ